MKNLCRYLLVLSAVLLAAACERRPLVDPDGQTEFRVRIITEGINNVTCNLYNPNLTPQTITSDMVRLLIYDPTGEQLITQAFASDKTVEEGVEVLSRRVDVPAGNYRVLGYNFDLGDTHFEHEERFSTLRAFTPEISEQLYARVGSRAEEIGTIYYEPEHVLVARERDLQLKATGDLQVVEMDATSVVDTYYIQIRISGMEYLAQSANGLAVLSGLSPSNLIGDDTPNHEESSAIYFEMLKSTDERITEENKDVLCAQFNTFGKIPAQPSSLQITLAVLSRDGTKHEKVVDMTPIFETEDARERHWLLIDEVWEIPEPVDPEGGGFSPTVDDWEDVEEVIPIGPNA